MGTVTASRLGTPFRDRCAAGQELAKRLEHLRGERPIVLALPRGGVPVGYEVAKALDAPLDVILVRKIGAPLRPEYGVGAIAEDGIEMVDARALAALGLRHRDLVHTIAREREELERRQRLYRRDRSPIPLVGRTAILVDDGVATGGTAIAAAVAARRRGATRVVLAVPVAPPDAESRFAGAVDEFVCLKAPASFFAVGSAYEDFDQVGDEEVHQLLSAAPGRADDRGEAADGAGDDPPRANGGLDWAQVGHDGVTIPAPGVRLAGDLRVPPDGRGLVIFAHGSGSSRLSPRNVQVASALNASGLATLLFDLLTTEEAGERGNVFDVPLLAERLVAATRWAQGDRGVGGLPIGYFGASTGAAAALCAAAELGGGIRAVVSRGGRPDLALERLAEVRSPTLLIVGGEDRTVLKLNELAAEQMRCINELTVVPGATHLFEEEGALERVAQLATDWFTRHLGLSRSGAAIEARKEASWSTSRPSPTVSTG